MGHAIAALLSALSLATAPAAAPPIPEPKLLFNIATTAGASDSTWAALSYDREHDELFAAFEGLAHVFNASGMETFVIGRDGDLGAIARVGVLPDGNLLLIASRGGGRRALLVCDFRGEPLGPFALAGLPEALAGFEPDQLRIQGGKLYLVQAGPMRVVVADLAGRVERVWDLAGEIHRKDPTLKTGMGGFWVDEQGALYFTVPLAFSAFVLSPAGELRQFGMRGSSPGKFNVVGAVTTDERGNLFILDRLRSVVLMFDPALKFVLEFGYRGEGPGNLIAPYDLAVGNGKIFVSQARALGVKVFRYELPAEPAGEPPIEKPPEPAPAAGVSGEVRGHG